MIDKKTIINYVMHTPYNTNPNVLESLLDAFHGSGGDTNLNDFIAGNTRFVDCDIDAIPDFAFAGKNQLEEVNIPNATYIGKYAFSTALVRSSSGSGSEEGSNLVYNNDKLTTVNMDSVTHICTGAFMNAKNLEITELPDSLTIIDVDAFCNCPKVQITKLPRNLTYIGDNALPLQENFPFDEVTNNITYIGSGFTYEQLHEYLDPLVSIEDGVLDLTNFPIAWLEIELSDSITYCQSLFKDIDTVTKIIFPEGITRIGNYIFSGCKNLETLNIPDSVVSIGNYAFNSCHALTTLNIPENVVVIKNGAFKNCILLQELTISDNVISIGNEAFSYCLVLHSLTIPNSVKDIGLFAFYDASFLTSFIMGNGVEFIGYGAFGKSDELTDIYYIGTEEEWNAITGISDAGFKGTETIHYNYTPSNE